MRPGAVAGQRYQYLFGLALAAVLCAGCRQDTLQPVESIAITDAPVRDTLRENGETVWLSGASAPVALRLSSRTAELLEPAVGRGTRLLGEAGGQLVLLRDRVLLGIHPDSAAPFRLAQGVETAILTAAEELLLYSIRDGEIVAVPTGDLRAAWGWAGLGSESTALAVSPEGDRVYQALGRREDPESPARLLVRDLLSGRILETIDVGEPIRAIEVTAAGDLVTVDWDLEQSDATVSRWEWRSGTLSATWATQIPAPNSPEDLRLAITSDGQRIAVAGINDEAGLTLIDGETGFTIADFKAATRDVTFDDLGRLYAVTDTAVLRLE